MKGDTISVFVFKMWQLFFRYMEFCSNSSFIAFSFVLFSGERLLESEFIKSEVSSVVKLRPNTDNCCFADKSSGSAWAIGFPWAEWIKSAMIFSFMGCIDFRNGDS